MAASFSQGVIRAEKLAIFTSSKEVDEFQIREFFLERWDFLSQGLDNGTMLFLAGVHGTKDGKVGEISDSLETMIRQVNSSSMSSSNSFLTEVFNSAQSLNPSKITSTINLSLLSVAFHSYF